MTDEEIAREIGDRLLERGMCVFPRSQFEEIVLAALRSARLAEREKKQPVYLLSEWNEGIGDVIWWKFPIDEPPYVGSPLDVGHTVEIAVRAHGVDKLMRVNVGGWPGYHTHWTPIVIPAIRETDSDA